MKHVINIPRQSARILLAQVHAPDDWCKGAKMYRAVGSMLDNEDIAQFSEMPLPKILEDESEGSYKERLNIWLAEEVTFELAEAQRDAIKAAINHATEKGTLPRTKYIIPIYDSLGIE